MKTYTRLDAAPLLAETRRRGLVLPQHSAERRAWQRAKERGWITTEAADNFVVLVLGMHPAEVWPDWYG